jgi:hypothetical protein
MNLLELTEAFDRRHVDVRCVLGRLVMAGTVVLLLAGCGGAVTEPGPARDDESVTESVPARDDEGDARAAAQQYAAALDANDEAAATRLTCTGTDSGALFPAFGGIKRTLPKEATKVTAVQVSSERATVELVLYGGGTTAVSLARKDGRWCVSY